MDSQLVIQPKPQQPKRKTRQSQLTPPSFLKGCEINFQREERKSHPPTLGCSSFPTIQIDTPHHTTLTRASYTRRGASSTAHIQHICLLSAVRFINAFSSLTLPYIYSLSTQVQNSPTTPLVLFSPLTFNLKGSKTQPFPSLTQLYIPGYSSRGTHSLVSPLFFLFCFTSLVMVIGIRLCMRVISYFIFSL